MRLLLCISIVCAATAANASEDRPAAEKYLLSGDIAGGVKAVSAIIAEKPDDAQARFGLGTLQFVGAIEHMIQGFYAHGLQPDPVGGMLPFVRLPVPANPNPQPIAYADLRAIMQTLATELAEAEGTLAEIKDDAVKMPIQFGLVRMDFNGDGHADEDETLWKIYSRLNRQVGRDEVSAKQAEGSDLAFDRGDVAWLRGYCHLLATFAETYLAYDGQALFDHTAHLFFAKPKTPFPFLRHQKVGPKQFETAWISDWIAFVHMVRLPVKEPKRMEAALAHMRSMTALSRESWAYYLKETDDDREWIPNPRQSTVVPGGKVTDEMVQGWMEFLDESDRILAGERLIPFWRDARGKGINLKRVFTEPTTLDAVLWFQGTAAAPYLEDGQITSPETWQRLQRVFRGEFIGFALWFN